MYIVKHVTEYLPKDTIIQHILDTSSLSTQKSILRDYITSRVYRDTINVKDQYSLFLTDSVTRNRLLSRSLEIKSLQKEYTQITLEVPERGFYVGGFTTFNTQDLNVGVEGSFVWNHQIFPLLKEYFYSQHEKLISFLNPFADDEGEADFENMLKEGEDLLFALNALTVGKENSEFLT